MTVNGGDNIAAGDVNIAQNRRIGTTTAVTDLTATSGTTEKVLDTITVSVVSGRTYRISYICHYIGSVAADGYRIFLREGLTTAGTQLTYFSADCPIITMILSRTGWVDWTASATGSQSFAACAARATGTGTLTARGAASQPRILSVDWNGF